MRTLAKRLQSGQREKMASSCVIRHNHGMRRLGVSVLLLAMWWLGDSLAFEPGPAGAQEVRTTQAPSTGVLRARGKTAKLIETDRRSERQASGEPALPIELNAGVISRALLQAELASGIGKFLQQVRAEPSVARGHFVGWRVTSLFANRADIHVQVLRPGDTVTRVNGQSIERPEQFKALWDEMASATELVLDIQREGRNSRLRYTIGP
jgi:type II secretory pathway component PulC